MNNFQVVSIKTHLLAYQVLQGFCTTANPDDNVEKLCEVSRGLLDGEKM